MKDKNSRRVGRTLYWLSWPMALAYLNFTKRTRILVTVGNEILVVRGWFGSGDWTLPGGGVGRGEPPEAGAVRELEEETGIVTKPAQLKLLFARRLKGRAYRGFFAYVYVLELGKKPELSVNTGEITDAKWVNWRKLKSDKQTHRTLKHILDVWQGKERSGTL